MSLSPWLRGALLVALVAPAAGCFDFALLAEPGNADGGRPADLFRPEDEKRHPDRGHDLAEVDGGADLIAVESGAADLAVADRADLSPATVADLAAVDEARADLTAVDAAADGAPDLSRDRSPPDQSQDQAPDACSPDVQVDPNNCGACGQVCSPNHVPMRTCAGGVCTGACAPGWADCNGDKLGDGCERFVGGSDVNNCGGCGAVCSAMHVPSPSCASGVCNGNCSPGWADCNNDKLRDGCETNINGVDVANCGGCGLKCSPNHISSPSCSGGICNGQCNPGFADCNNDKLLDGCEVDITIDPKNCGACGKTCPSNQCSNSMCVTVCGPGFADCYLNNMCENLNTDPLNCGACNMPCSTLNVATVICGRGSCESSVCVDGFRNCFLNKRVNGCETNINSDVDHCGGCGNACVAPNATSQCSTGTCAILMCSAGWVDCNGAYFDGCEININTDPANCGGCTMACMFPNATPKCTAAMCGIAACIAPWMDCDGLLANGCEINTSNDINHCGGCSLPCSTNNMATVTCGNGVCDGMCKTGFADCNNNKQTDGCEADLNADPKNCGTCMRACNGAALACVNGACGCRGVNDCDPAYADRCRNGTCGCGMFSGACDPATSRCSGGFCRFLPGQPCTFGAQCISGSCSAQQVCL